VDLQADYVLQPVRTVCGPFLDRFRGDPEVDRLLDAMCDAHPGRTALQSNEERNTT